jgi:hypothetical protein
MNHYEERELFWLGFGASLSQNLKLMLYSLSILSLQHPQYLGMHRASISNSNSARHFLCPIIKNYRDLLSEN